MTVTLAAFLTALVTISLTLYACLTEHDFTFASGSLYLLTAAFLGCIFLTWYMPASHFLRVIISGVSVVLFGLYLIFDIQMIVGGGHFAEFTVDDYIVAAL
jgi:FtsH-binding integral membrane protein